MKKRLPRPAGWPLLIFLLSICIACDGRLRQDQSAPTALPTGLLRVRSTPEGAAIVVSGQPQGHTPVDLPLPPGEWRLEFSYPGYLTHGVSIALAAGAVITLPVALQDVSPPSVEWEDLPAQPEQGATLLIRASASDNAGLSRLELSIDGEACARTDGEPLVYSWETATARPGEHLLRIEATDLAGNRTSEERRVVLVIPPPTTTPTPAAPAPTASPLPRPSAAPVAIRRGALDIATYQYRQALRSDPQSPAYPYPGLDRSRVGPPVPVRYETIILENEYLRLVFLPELGGRLYQCTYLPTGQNLFYNNTVIKPSPWGPPEMGWWLAAGGMEWCLPVDEHGYLTAEPWEAETARNADGSATVRLSCTERTRNIRAQVAVTLAPGEARFHVTTTLRNLDAEARQFQYWLNAMLSPGTPSLSPSTRFLLPASEVVVHSTGDGSLGSPHSTIAWPTFFGRDLSVYGSWRNYLGVFAPTARAGYMGIYAPEADLGMARVFPRETVPGVKLFAFGLGFDPSLYTDDGSQYAELWGGVTPSFWDWATLPPQGALTWTETWLPVHGLGGLSGASREVVFRATWDGAAAHLAVTTPRVQDLAVSIADERGEFYRQACTAGPERPFRATVRPGRDVVGAPVLRVSRPDGTLLIEHIVGPS